MARLGIALVLVMAGLSAEMPAIEGMWLREMPDSLLPVGYFLCLPESTVTADYTDCDSFYVHAMPRIDYRLFMPRGIDDILTEYQLFSPKPRTEFSQSGSISRGFSFGTGKDLSVQSDFNFEATGKIGGHTEIRAVLSDQRSPIQPEGNTTTLSELDKVYIEAVSKHYSARLGDIEIDEGDGFFRLSRKLKGIYGDISFDEAGARAAGAVLEGEKRSQLIIGQEGNNGPYKLTDKKGSSNITIIAGSEKLWLDGKPLERGENRDYIIDYNTAEIEFMPRITITGNSRIAIDFEYTRQEYQSALYYGGAYGVLPDIVSIRADFSYQGDRKENPLSFDISDTDREALALLGDADSAFIDGWQEDSLGDYIMEDGHFVYVGDSLGDYSVDFSPFDGGGYERSDSFYVYVGADSGDYAPLREIDLPVSLSMLSISAQSDTALPFFFTGELATSTSDRNTFSPVDDGDNTGFAGRLELESPQFGTSLGELGMAYSFTGVDNRFSSTERIWSTDYDRDWGFPESQEGRNVHMLSLFTEGKPVTVRLEGGHRQDIEGWQGYRIEPSADIVTSVFETSFMARLTESGRDTLGGRGLLTALDSRGEWGLFEPELSLAAERRSIETGDTTEGEEYGLANTRLGLHWDKFTIAPIVEYRMDRRHSIADLYDYSRAYTIGMDLDTDLLDILVKRRIYEALSPDAGTDLKTNSADIGWQFNVYERIISIRGDYMASGALNEQKEKVYTYVGPGRGNYSIEPTATDGYIIDPEGDYILEYEGTGIFTPTTDMELSTRLTASPQWEGRPRLSISLNADQSYAGRGMSALLPKPDGMDKDTLVKDGTFRLEGSLSWKLWKGTLRTGSSWRKSANRRFTSGDEISRSTRIYGTYDIKTGSLRLETDIDLETRNRSYPGGWRENTDIFSTSVTERTTYSDLDILTPSLSATLKSSDERAGEPYSVMAITITPEARASLKKGSIRGELSYTRLNVSREVGLIPYDIGGGRYPGDNIDWELSASWRFIPQSITTATIKGESYPDLDPKITMDIKVQYIF